MKFRRLDSLMKQAKLHIDRHFQVGEVDKRIFGSFIEHLGRAVYWRHLPAGSPLSDKEECVGRNGAGSAAGSGGSLSGRKLVSCFHWEGQRGPKELRPAEAGISLVRH